MNTHCVTVRIWYITQALLCDYVTICFTLLLRHFGHGYQLLSPSVTINKTWYVAYDCMVNSNTLAYSQWSNRIVVSLWVWSERQPNSNLRIGQKCPQLQGAKPTDPWGLSPRTAICRLMLPRWPSEPCSVAVLFHDLNYGCYVPPAVVCQHNSAELCIYLTLADLIIEMRKELR